MLDARTVWIAVCFAALGGVSCSPNRGPEVGGETHWLALCSHDSECGDEGLVCVCGTCTRACTGDDSCQSGQCYDTRSPVLRQRCEDRDVEGSHAVCLAQCESDRECGQRRSCVRGACVPVLAGALTGVSDEVSWSEPLQVTRPRDAIDNADDSLLGTWANLDCSPNLWDSCMKLVIERNASGVVQGRFHSQPSEDFSGPYAPATDPDRGYPHEVSPDDYSLVRDSIADLDYRVLDGHVTGDRLTFGWSPFELWRDWCTLQRPYPWQIAGRTLFYCVPQAAEAQAAFDLGKIVLCRSADVEPVCEDQQPCVCSEPGNPRCSPAVCECDAQGCDLPSRMTFQEIVFSADRSSGRLQWLAEPGVPTELRRVSP